MNRAELNAATAHWRSNIIAFAEECLHDPETGRPFVLYAEEQEFLRRAFTLTPEGRLPYTELCFGAGKKSGKTALAAIIAIYTPLYLSPFRGEIYCLANDLEQSTSRVFRAVASILSASPLLHRSAAIAATR